MPRPTPVPMSNSWLYIFKELMAESVRRGNDLTLRQFVALLKVYLESETEHTVRGLAASMQVPKNAIVRALDRLEELQLIRRACDPADKRSIVAQKTVAGVAYLRSIEGHLGSVMRCAGRSVGRRKETDSDEPEPAAVASRLNDAVVALKQLDSCLSAALRALEAAQAELEPHK